jgi:hypothetical protein
MLTRDTALYHHLRYNHFPSAARWIDQCRAAIVSIELDPDDPLGVEMPNGSYADPWSIIEAFHLDGFIETEEVYL